MPVAEDTLPGTSPVVDIVVGTNMPVAEVTLPGTSPVVYMVVGNHMPVPGNAPVVDIQFGCTV
jgi:hypothetical protein